MDGIELRGAKQNRMVNVTIVAAHGAETEIPVSCVEAGRWSYRSKRFAAADRTVSARLRGLKARMVAENLHGNGRAQTDQGKVWDRVQGYLRETGSRSATSALEDAFIRRANEVEAAVETLEKLKARGAIVALGGQIIGLDLFDSEKTFAKTWPQLLRGLAMDAFLERQERPKPVSLAEVRAWLASLDEEATPERREVPGVGTHYGVAGASTAGGITLHQGRTVHVALFRDEGSSHTGHGEVR